MPRPSASPALRVLRTLRTGSRMTLRRHKDFLALAGALQKIAGYRGPTRRQGFALSMARSVGRPERVNRVLNNHDQSRLLWPYH